MSTDKYFAIRISFHPDPKVEYKECFHTYTDAKNMIESLGKSGDNWIIIKEEQNTFALVNGIMKYQNKHG